MRVAYEHIRLIPSDDLEKEITGSYLEEDIVDINHEELRTPESIESNETETLYKEIFGTDSDIEDGEELKPIGVASTLLANNVTGDPKKDIGNQDSTNTSIDERELESIHEDTLNEFFKITCGKQITRQKLACAPKWLLDKALAEEL